VLTVFDGHAQYLEPCLAAIENQTEPRLEVILVDNTTSGVSHPRDSDRVLYRIVRNAAVPSFYCKNNNLGLNAARGKYALVLNLDVKLQPDYVSACADALDRDSSAGIAIGRLRRMDSSLRPLDPPVLDSTGMTVTAGLRHLDRDAGVQDIGQHTTAQYLIGATGAAPMFRMSMVRDLALSDGTWFDEDFEMGREDADTSWRAWMAGWRCIYLPNPLAYHIRTGAPGTRRKMSARFNMHQVKNRYLLRLNNLPLGTQLVLCPSWLWRDLSILAYVVLFERSSFDGYLFLIRERRRLLKKRAFLRARWRRTWLEVARCFLGGGIGNPWPHQQDVRNQP